VVFNDCPCNALRQRVSLPIAITQRFPELRRVFSRTLDVDHIPADCRCRRAIPFRFPSTTDVLARNVLAKIPQGSLFTALALL
jgi:hypothetical protein